MKKIRTGVLLLLSVGLSMLACCTCRLPSTAGPASVQTQDSLVLYRRPLHIRLAQPAVVPPNPILIVYATGDGGWHGIDDRVFQCIADSGWPATGFSSKEYLRNLRYALETDTTTPRRLVRDYQRIIAFARNRLHLPDETPILLVGNSRGAGLSVVAAGQGELKPHLAGLIGIALTKEEEHVVRYRRRGMANSPAAPRRERIEIKTYEYLPRLSSFPVCVIQSTGDGYLPAEAARRLFGPDGPLRRFRPIMARNHSFSGGCDQLYGEVLSAMNWISATVQPKGPAVE